MSVHIVTSYSKQLCRISQEHGYNTQGNETQNIALHVRSNVVLVKNEVQDEYLENY